MAGIRRAYVVAAQYMKIGGEGGPVRIEVLLDLPTEKDGPRQADDNELEIPGL